MNKFEADEILNLAMMEKTPYIIVEGADDIRVYEEISGTAGVFVRFTLSRCSKGFREAMMER